MNNYNVFNSVTVGDSFKVESIEYELIEREEFKNSIELVVKNFTDNDVHSIFLDKTSLTVTHEDGYSLWSILIYFKGVTIWKY